jgi:serine/threonine-protein kinase
VSRPEDTEVDPTVDLTGGEGAETVDLEGARPAGVFPTRSGATGEPPDPAPDELAARATPRSRPGHTTTLSGTIDSAASALAHTDILRSRFLGKLGVGLALAVAAAVPVLGGSPVGQVIVLSAAAVVFVTNVWLIYIAGDPDRYRPWAIGIIWYSSSVAVGAGVTYFGVYSAAPLAAGLGIFFVALGGSRALALGVYLSIALVIAAVVVLSAAGWIVDPGLITIGYMPPEHQLILAGLVQAILAAIFVLGRHSRKVTRLSMQELEAAVRALAQNHALLDEARQDLHRALQVGGAGPWSGRQIGGHEIGALIGRGAMGEVYEVVDLGTGDRAAIKLLTPASAADPRLVERFRREVEITQRLSCENVVRVLGVSGPGDPIPFLIMELLDGDDLATILREQPVMAIDEVTRLVADVAAGLEAAFGAGIVHRDIKPQNLFRTRALAGPRWKILDFGISKLAATSGTLTQGHVVGTPAYMAPEQATATDQVDHRADTYALAAIAYRCLTGRQPFRGKQTASILYNVVYTMPLRPSSLAALPGEIDLVLAVAMAKDPGQRFSLAGELAEALTAALAGELDSRVAGRGRELLARTPWREP